MDMLALTDFSLVAAHGGFSRASRASGRAKATLSRHVLELEHALGVRLLERSPRSTRLTEQGRALHESTKDLLSEIRAAADAVTGGHVEPAGVLRISAPLLFAHVHLGIIAAEFVAAYPHVLLEATVENRIVDLVDEGYNLVIRANPALTEDLVGRCFMRDQMLVVAPPSLAMPTRDAIDAEVPTVVVSGGSARSAWEYRSGSDITRFVSRPVLSLTSMLTVRDAACAGAGAATLPASLVRAELDAGRLACWGESTEPQVEIWVLHTSRRLVSSKVRAFMELLLRAFP